MQKYKHIPTGEIWLIDKEAIFLYKHKEQYSGQIPFNIVKNSKDWEEIKETPKAFEIVAFKHLDSGKIFTKRESGLFIDQKWTLEASGSWSEPVLMKNLGISFSIHSVKRLSDRKTFSVGDKIRGTMSIQNKKIGYVTITSFTFLYSGKMAINHTTGIRHEDEFNEEIQLFKPIGTTRDGVEVGGNQTVYLVIKDSDKYPVKVQDFVANDVVGAINDEGKTPIMFFKRENAEDFMRLQRELYTLKKAIERDIKTRDSFIRSIENNEKTALKLKDKIDTITYN